MGCAARLLEVPAGIASARRLWPMAGAVAHLLLRHVSLVTFAWSMPGCQRHVMRLLPSLGSAASLRRQQGGSRRSRRGWGGGGCNVGKPQPGKPANC